MTTPRYLTTYSPIALTAANHDPRVFTYHCAYCSNLFLASTHDFSALPKRKDPGLDHAIIVPLPPPPKSEDESDSSSSEESSSDEEEDEPEERTKPVEAKPEAPSTQPSEKAPEATTTPAATSSVPVTSMAPPPAPSTTLPADSAPATIPTLREKDDYTLILSLTKDRTAQIITREDGFEKRWIWRCGRCRIISGYQLDDAHFDPPGSTGQSETMDEKEKKRNDRKRKRYLYILPGAVLPTEELGRELKEKEIDVLGVEI
ncbi:hypothetical protein DFP73DRAFT_486399 [Morchella snyderi]|nr:hypothetical protein DFP73DRAFT_486399 [Morchella snyderi]